MLARTTEAPRHKKRRRKRFGRGEVPFPHDDLPVVPLAPVARTSKDRGSTLSQQKKEEVDRNIHDLLWIIRARKVAPLQAFPFLARFLKTKPSKLSAQFYCYATKEELLAADILAAIWQRRWKKMESLLSAHKKFIHVCNAVGESENLSGRAIYINFMNSSYVTDEQWDIVAQRFPKINK